MESTIKINKGQLQGVVESVVAGTNVTVDNTDPKNPIINSTGGGGGADAKRTFNIDYYLGGAMNASTSWYARAPLSAFGIFTTNAALTPSNNFANLVYQNPTHVIPFKSKIKSIIIRGWSNGTGNPVRMCVVKSNNVVGNSAASTIVNPLIIGDVTFNSNLNSYKFFFNSTGLDLTTVLDELTEIRIVLFNNNTGGTPLQDTFINLEFEEVL
jgi:hypothetical protein